MSYIREYTADFTLTGGECNAESRMPLTLVAERVIEVATMHANHLNVGFDDLAKRGEAWVLSRLSIEMTRYPRINERYRLVTWVASVNRRFSERHFLFTNPDGEVLGHARTVWVTINIATRQMGELVGVDGLLKVMSDRRAPIEPYPRMGAFTAEAARYPYTFRYTDIDVNRHVNSVVYIRALLDTWGLDHHDSTEIARFDIAYMHEGYFGEEAVINRADNPGADGADALMTGADGRQIARMRVIWRDVTSDK